MRTVSLKVPEAQLRAQTGRLMAFSIGKISLLDPPNL
jgi:hypothetical protein